MSAELLMLVPQNTSNLFEKKKICFQLFNSLRTVEWTYVIYVSVCDKCDGITFRSIIEILKLRASETFTEVLNVIYKKKIPV